MELYIYRRQDFGKQSTKSKNNIKLYGGNKEYKECGVGLAISECNVELGKRKTILGFVINFLRDGISTRNYDFNYYLDKFSYFL